MITSIDCWGDRLSFSILKGLEQEAAHKLPVFKIIAVREEQDFHHGSFGANECGRLRVLNFQNRQCDIVLPEMQREKLTFSVGSLR